MLIKEVINDHKVFLDFAEKVYQFLDEKEFLENLKIHQRKQPKFNDICDDNPYVVVFALLEVFDLYGYLDLVQTKKDKSTYIQFTYYMPSEEKVELLKEETQSSQDILELSLLTTVFNEMNGKFEDFITNFNKNHNTKFKAENLQLVDTYSNLEGGFDYHDMRIEFEFEEFEDKLEVFNNFFFELLVHLMMNWHISYTSKELNRPDNFFKSGRY